MALPPLNEATIRNNATTQSFERGVTYANGGAVVALTQRGKQLQAEVEGSEASPYYVTIQFDDGGVTEARCSCPYDYAGWCKHIVATVLMGVRHPSRVEVRPTLEQLLDRLDWKQTQGLVKDLVLGQPELIEAIDRYVSLLTVPINPQESAQTPRATAIDPAPFRRQVKQLIRDNINRVEEGWDDDLPFVGQLSEVVEKADAFTERGNGQGAIAILEAITAACADDWDDLSDYGAESDELMRLLNDSWTAAVLSAELSDEQKVNLAVMLEEWQEALGGSFEMTMAAMKQGWDYPPLQLVLSGQVTEQGAWAREAPDFADALALVRLEILDRQGRDREYLYLAEAEGQILQYLMKLVELDEIETLVATAKNAITEATEAFILAKALRERNHLGEALEIAQIGLNFSGYVKYELATWTSDLAEGLGHSQVALEVKIIAFKERPSFQDYRRIEALAGRAWTRIKQDLLHTLRTYAQWGADEAQVDIFLYEGLVDDAIDAVRSSSSYRSELVMRVMESAILHRPDWVIEKARQLAEPIMDGGKADRYDQAVRWLRQVRAAYLQLGQIQEWSKYRAELVMKHGAKRKLMGLFGQGGME